MGEAKLWHIEYLWQKGRKRESEGHSALFENEKLKVQELEADGRGRAFDAQPSMGIGLVVARWINRRSMCL